MGSHESFAGDLAWVPALKEIGLALAKYASSLSGSVMQWEKEQWVFRPANFVTFRVQPRDGSIKLSLRGHPNEFALIDGLELRDSMGNGAYSTCKITSPSQLAAAALHVRRAYQLFGRGRSRARKRLCVSETEAA